FLGRDYTLFLDVSRHKTSRWSTNPIALKLRAFDTRFSAEPLPGCWWPCDVKRAYRNSDDESVAQLFKECCAAHFGVSFNSLLVGGVFAVTAEPPLSVNT